MQRLLLKELILWKESNDRLPIMLDGARQVGKSFLIEKLFGEQYFDNVFKLNFEDTPAAIDLFSGSLKADDILKNISIYYQQDFNAETDLLFFDEIGLCSNALNSLKYFKEQRPDVYLCASGSNIGLIDRYPVGQTHELTLYPMSFNEFVLASENKPLIRAFENRDRTLVVHEHLSELYRQYLYVGGMPAVVKRWFSSDSPLIKKTQEIRKLQDDLVIGYIRDFGKYDAKSKFLASYLEAVFRNVPKQLSQSIDTSVKRFKFSHIIQGKASYRDFHSLIDYLVSTHLISKSQIIEGEIPQPLALNNSESRFKLFSHDIGILHSLLGLSYKQVIDQSFSYKGYAVENFAQNELLASGVKTTYSWQSYGKAEIEFLVANAHGDIIPIEIKSGQHTKAKSLDVYLKRYQPKIAYKLCDLAGGIQENKVHTRPLYYISHVAQSLTNEWNIDNYF